MRLRTRQRCQVILDEKMNEIEIKILGIDPAEIKKKLKKAGAKTVFENTLVNARCYDFPNKKIRKAKNHVRLRKIGNKVELTYKELKSKAKYKINEETDIVINIKDFKLMQKFLEKLGMKAYADYRKKRSRYRLGKWQYEIDKYPGIPHYVEVEVKSCNIAKGKKELEKAVKLIGFTMKDAKPWNGFEVHKYYKKKI